MSVSQPSIPIKKQIIKKKDHRSHGYSILQQKLLDEVELPNDLLYYIMELRTSCDCYWDDHEKEFKAHEFHKNKNCARLGQHMSYDKFCEFLTRRWADTVEYLHTEHAEIGVYRNSPSVLLAYSEYMINLFETCDGLREKLLFEKPFKTYLRTEIWSRYDERDSLKYLTQFTNNMLIFDDSVMDDDNFKIAYKTENAFLIAGWTIASFGEDFGFTADQRWKIWWNQDHYETIKDFILENYAKGLIDSHNFCYISFDHIEDILTKNVALLRKAVEKLSARENIAIWDVKRICKYADKLDNEELCTISAYKLLDECTDRRDWYPLHELSNMFATNDKIFDLVHEKLNKIMTT